MNRNKCLLAIVLIANYSAVYSQDPLGSGGGTGNDNLPHVTVKLVDGTPSVSNISVLAVPGGQDSGISTNAIHELTASSLLPPNMVQAMGRTERPALISDYGYEATTSLDNHAILFIFLGNCAGSSYVNRFNINNKIRIKASNRAKFVFNGVELFEQLTVAMKSNASLHGNPIDIFPSIACSTSESLVEMPGLSGTYYHRRRFGETNIEVNWSFTWDDEEGFPHTYSYDPDDPSRLAKCTGAFSVCFPSDESNTDGTTVLELEKTVGMNTSATTIHLGTTFMFTNTISQATATINAPVQMLP